MPAARCGHPSLVIGVRCAGPCAAAAAMVYADFSRRLTRFSQSLCCLWSTLIMCVTDLLLTAIANNEEAIMQEIYSNGPIVAGFMVYADFPH